MPAFATRSAGSRRHAAEGNRPGRRAWPHIRASAEPEPAASGAAAFERQMRSSQNGARSGLDENQGRAARSVRTAPQATRVGGRGDVAEGAHEARAERANGPDGTQTRAQRPPTARPAAANGAEKTGNDGRRAPPGPRRVVSQPGPPVRRARRVPRLFSVLIHASIEAAQQRRFPVVGAGRGRRTRVGSIHCVHVEPERVEERRARRAGRHSTVAQNVMGRTPRTASAPPSAKPATGAVRRPSGVPSASPRPGLGREARLPPARKPRFGPGKRRDACLTKR